MRRGSLIACGLALAGLWVPALPGADSAVVKEAVANFPPQTVRFEYSSPVKLRALPDYGKLRQRYMAPQLEKLVSRLSKLGIEENDIDDLVLGWQLGEGE